MAELLALPTVAPVAALPAMLDGAITATAVTPADPFAAFLATAQVAPVVTPALPPVVAPVSPAIVGAEQALPKDIEAHVSDEDATDAASDEQAIDPALSPALALLAALVAPKADAPRVASPAPSRATIVAVAPQQTHPQPLPQAGGEQKDKSPIIGQQPQSPLPLAGGVGGEQSALKIPIELLAEATPQPVKQLAVAPTKPADAEVPVTAELVASTDAPPVQPKTRALPPVVTKTDAVIATAIPRRADRAEQAATPLKHVVESDASLLETVVPPMAASIADAANPDHTAPAIATDQLIQRQLVIADDGRWLDSLARDIAQSASGETIRFKLEPVNLGSLTVAIAQGSDGAAIRLTAETHRARDLLVDAQPALVAEARANGLRISETHVDLGSGNRDDSGGNTPAGGQSSFANAKTGSGQQAMRQDGNARRQPDLPAPLSNQPRSSATRAQVRDGGERFA